ncbi:putative L-ascorbate peroxidase 6, chloroplastic/mitochondrial [Canna indica]|uniref:L-ascorbate peroxidase n=1 Tax=Canna indica TaxID=4628 RepID=A0AAQ3KR34_9LILI|nr:putative L-ascorbate peroxidase 6, chloroplastic/mitochondrial [Canna indica]
MAARLSSSMVFRLIPAAPTFRSSSDGLLALTPRSISSLVRGNGLCRVRLPSPSFLCAIKKLFHKIFLLMVMSPCWCAQGPAIVWGLGASRGAASDATSSASDPAQLRSARDDIKELLKSASCHPILVRLGWHDAGTYDKNIEEWPKRGGANGSLRFDIELKHAANAGLVNALKLLQPIKDKYSGVTYADLFQLASATSIEDSGGPKIPMKYGRVDVSGPEQCVDEGRLPAAGRPSPAAHLRDVFYRMGLSDKEIVALCGAHTLGRARPERSGWGKLETKYTKDGPGRPGGQSWTVQWLKFDNSYFKDIKERKDEDLLVLPTDASLFEDPSFKVYAERYAANQDTFFSDYAEAHAKLSNLGAKFDPPEDLTILVSYVQILLSIRGVRLGNPTVEFAWASNLVEDEKWSMEKLNDLFHEDPVLQIALICIPASGYAKDDKSVCTFYLNASLLKIYEEAEN